MIPPSCLFQSHDFYLYVRQVAHAEERNQLLLDGLAQKGVGRSLKDPEPYFVDDFFYF
jgi:hypothetical protein